MRVLSDINSFLDRFANFVDTSLKSIDIVSPSIITVTFHTQDRLRGYDWVGVTLEFSGVSDARVIEPKQLDFVDMSDGITLTPRGFAIGSYNESNLSDSICFVLATSIKYSEFSL